MKCTLCGEQTVYVRQYDKLALCIRHFNEQMRKRVQKTITRYKMLGRKDRIAIGVSGGKDSIALLDIMSRIEKDFPESNLVAIIIDEGIENYRDEGLHFAKMNAERLNIEHHVFSFKHDFGYGLDNIIEILGERGKDREYGACSYCGILRRKILNKAAKEVGADVLLTGHNLEDEAETVLLNIIRGDIQRLVRLDPKPRKIHHSLVPRAKPFRTTPQAEIVMYCYLNDLEYQEIPCPYAVEAYRGDVRDFIFKTQEKQPMLSFNIVRGLDKLLKMVSDIPTSKKMQDCTKCGEAAASDLCRGCWLKDKVESIKGLK
ncbi:MAG: TIGR00269 family protein [Candidatus Heimdallarchaeota archaeon]|nr:TIGR00269 family protein [Candidatus Heimdallarchaeota archaeon]MCK5142638.1 TIGR00269 family protein [Candidatus Heimdallarchaeota archaeon]